MSRGRKHLSYVSEKLDNKTKELQETIDEVQKDIEGMNEYYWENYTEMDQYGYENFDNQQALLAQVNTKQEHAKTRKQFKKMKDSPFFGSVDFIYDGEDEAEAFKVIRQILADEE